MFKDNIGSAGRSYPIGLTDMWTLSLEGHVTAQWGGGKVSVPHLIRTIVKCAYIGSLRFPLYFRVPFRWPNTIHVVSHSDAANERWDYHKAVSLGAFAF
jgi:hypothetical protein